MHGFILSDAMWLVSVPVGVSVSANGSPNADTLFLPVRKSIHTDDPWQKVTVLQDVPKTMPLQQNSITHSKDKDVFIP